MIDVHAHLLPGVDDGPSTWDEAVGMVKLAAEEGITQMVATSHMMAEGAFVNTRTDLLPLVNELRRRIHDVGLDVQIHPGGEVYMTYDVVRRLERGELLTYCDAGRYMLLEMPSGEMPRYAGDVIFDLKLAGITPVIAHPERNMDVMAKPERVTELLEQGALLQVNISSLGSRQPIQRTARWLLEHGLVQFLATDAHGLYHRRPRIRKYVERVRSWAGDELVQRLLTDNPAALLSGEAIEVSVSEPEPQQKSWFGRLTRRFAGRGR